MKGIDHFQKKFLEEAHDHINDLEESLLELEHNPENREYVERIFRAMHSLKGGGSMFGFVHVSDFTHHLESLYEEVRNGRIVVTRDLLTLTLSAVDHIKLLLGTTIPTQDTLSKGLTLVSAAEKMSKQDTIIEKEEKFSFADEDVDYGNCSDGCSSWYISFKTKENILDNGTNPFYLIDDLSNLGKCKAFPIYDRLPNLDTINSQLCYTDWEILLATKADTDAIHDVFLFVEDDCHLDIEKIADRNIFEDTEQIESLVTHYSAVRSIDLSLVKKLFTVPQVAKKEKKQDAQVTSAAVQENQIASIRVAASKIDELMNMVSELVTVQARLSLYAENQIEPELVVIAENIAKISRQLRDNAFSISLIPLKNVVTRFQRLVRDLSIELNKDVKFITEGTETELDKTIIESLTDPVMHILRNSLDHGLESAQERIAAGKSPQGTIWLKALYSGTQVHMVIKDDGRGLDAEKIREKAIERGLIGADVFLTDKELFEMIFQAGFSTAEKITDVSGRGVGMDVVRRKIANIRGEVELQSEKGKGTTVIIKLPVTLSIIDGLLAKINETHFIIPLSVVNKIYPVNHEELVNNYKNMVTLDGEQIPYHYLRDYFNVTENVPRLEQIVVVNFDDRKVGIVVDRVVGEYQAVLKALGRHYKDQEMISGATILGDGSVALVLDTSKIIRAYSE